MPLSEQSIERLWEGIEDYGKTTYELSKLRAVLALSQVITSLVSGLAVVLSATLFLLVFSTGAALFIGDLMGKMHYGFFIVALFYLISAIAMRYFLRGWMSSSVIESVIRQSLHK